MKGGDEMSNSNHKVRSECKGCLYKKDCGGFRDREGRCPEWVMNEVRRLKEVAHSKEYELLVRNAASFRLSKIGGVG